MSAISGRFFSGCGRAIKKHQSHFPALNSTSKPLSSRWNAFTINVGNCFNGWSCTDMLAWVEDDQAGSCSGQMNELELYCDPSPWHEFVAELRGLHQPMP